MGQLIYLFGPKTDEPFLRSILKDLVGEGGGLLSGVFDEKWGGYERAYALYLTFATKHPSLNADEEKALLRLGPGKEQRRALIERSLPVFSEFIEKAVREKIEAARKAPRADLVHLNLIKKLEAAPIEKGLEETIDFIAFSDEWDEWRAFQNEWLPIKNAEAIMEGHLHALATALVKESTIAGSMRRGTPLEGEREERKRIVAKALSALGAESMGMIKEEMIRIKGVLAKKYETLP